MASSAFIDHAPGAMVSSAERRRQGGQAFVELALLLPIMLLLLLAAADLGRVFYAQIAVTNAARAGALEAGRHPYSYVADATCDATTNRVMCAVAAEAATLVTIQPADVELVCDPDPCSETLGSKVEVAVTGHFDLLTPILAVFTGGQHLTMTSTASAQIATEPIVATGSPAPPVVDFMGNPTTGVEPLTVAFVDLSSGSPTSWSWDFGDGTISASQNPTHTYVSAGTYDVTLTATSAQGSTAVTKAGYVVVSPLAPSPTPTPSGAPSPTPTPSPSPTPICYAPVADFAMSPNSGKKKKTEFQFTDLSITTPECPLTWSWNFGDGAGQSSTSTEQNPTRIYETQGVYTITLVVSSAGGQDSHEHTVTVTP